MERINMNKISPQDFIERCIEESIITFEKIKVKINGKYRTIPYYFNSVFVGTHLNTQFLAKAFITTILKYDIKFDMLFSGSFKGYSLVEAISTDKINICNIFAGNSKQEFPDVNFISGHPLRGNILIIETDIVELEKSIKYIKDQGNLPIAAIVPYDEQLITSKDMTFIQQLQSKYNIPIFSIATINDILSYLKLNNRTIDHDAIESFQLKYGYSTIDDKSNPCLEVKKPVKEPETLIEENNSIMSNKEEELDKVRDRFIQYCVDNKLLVLKENTKDNIKMLEPEVLCVSFIYSKNQETMSIINDFVTLLGIKYDVAYYNLEIINNPPIVSGSNILHITHNTEENLKQSIKKVRRANAKSVAILSLFGNLISSSDELLTKEEVAELEYGIPVYSLIDKIYLNQWICMKNNENMKIEKERIEKISKLKDKFMQHCINEEIIIFTDVDCLIRKDILNDKNAFINKAIDEIIKLNNLEHNRIYGTFCRYDTLFTKSDKVLIIDEDVEDMKESVKTAKESGVDPVAAIVLFCDVDPITEEWYSVANSEDRYKLPIYSILSKSDIMLRKGIEESKRLKVPIKNEGFDKLNDELYEKDPFFKVTFNGILTELNKITYLNRIMGPFKCLVKPFFADYDANMMYPENHFSATSKPYTATSDKEIHDIVRNKSPNHKNIQLLYKENKHFKTIVDTIHKLTPSIPIERIWEFIFCDPIDNKEVYKEYQIVLKDNDLLLSLGDKVTQQKIMELFNLNPIYMKSNKKKENIIPSSSENIKNNTISSEIAPGIIISYTEDNSLPIHEALKGLSWNITIDNPLFKKSEGGDNLEDSSIDIINKEKDSNSHVFDNLYFTSRYNEELSSLNIIENRIKKINIKVKKLKKKTKISEKINSKIISLTNEVDFFTFILTKLIKK